MPLNNKEIAKRFFTLFPVKNQTELAEILGVTSASVSDWKHGRSAVPWERLMQAVENKGVSWDWLLAGKEVVREPSNARIREPVNFVLEAKSYPVVGRAAADESQGANAGFFPPDAKQQWDGIVIPESTAFVEILGNSMSPVLLDRQFAFIGQELLYEKPPNYSIVVADVQVNEEDQSGSDRRWEGVYCKRVVDLDSVWAFLSISHTGTPFTIAKQNCRLWPVVGVWFAGHGVPPMED